MIEQPPLDSERIVEMLALAVALTALAAALLAIMSSGLAAGARRIRHRRSLLAPGESMFVGRWGREGPELFVVGVGSRRLFAAQRGKPDLAGCEVARVLAARMLFEILARRPSGELVWSFAEERLAYLPADGFVIPTSEVFAWLDTREAAVSGDGGRALELLAAGAALVTSRLRAAGPRVEEGVPPARSGARGQLR